MSVAAWLALGAAQAADSGDAAPATSGSASAMLYALRNQPDCGVGVAALNHGAWRFEARYNYEAQDSASVFVGRKWTGGEAVSYEVTPLVGAAFGALHGAIAALEASAAYRSFDVYVEAEYVHDLDHHGASYFYTWNELGWRPVEPVRVGLVGQRTRVVDSERSLQRGLFAQALAGAVTVSLYAFNPDSASSRYLVFSLGAQF